MDTMENTQYADKNKAGFTRSIRARVQAFRDAGEQAYSFSIFGVYKT
jgi:hypothetical protein